MSARNIIISGKDEEMITFVENAINAFEKEFLFFINHNSDPDVLEYFLESTYLSMMINGLIRQDGSTGQISAAQEYSTFRGQLKANGRVDAFVRNGQMAIWIEGKKETSEQKLNHDEHWDIEGWLKYDYDKVMKKQLKEYYEVEGQKLNDTYSGHYLMTIMFKIIREDPDFMIKMAEEKLEKRKNDHFDRGWYYKVLFLEKENKVFGLEVYGTFIKEK